MKEIDFKALAGEITALLNSTRVMTLATCSQDRVTARSISIINEGLTIYFQTDSQFLKYQQISQNQNVALSMDNLQIEGRAHIMGHPYDHENHHFLEEYKKQHELSFLKYSHLDTERVIKVKPLLMTLWKYYDNHPCREILNFNNLTSKRKFYEIGVTL